MSKYSTDSNSSSGNSVKQRSRPRSKSSKCQVRSPSCSSSDSHYSYQKKSHKSRRKRSGDVRSRSRSKTRCSKTKHSGHSSRTVDRVRSRSSSKSQNKSVRDKIKTNSRSRRRSRSRHRSRSHSADKSKLRSKSSSQESHSPNLRTHSTTTQEPSTQEQLHSKLQKAIKAAQTADDQLRQQGLLSKSVIARKDDIVELSIPKPPGSVLDEINDSSFVPKHFTSSKSSFKRGQADIPIVDLTGDMQISVPILIATNVDEPGSIFHSSLFVAPEQKIDKWVRKLFHLRQKAINGEPILNF